jgi:hypothetical protein
MDLYKHEHLICRGGKVAREAVYGKKLDLVMFDGLENGVGELPRGDLPDTEAPDGDQALIDEGSEVKSDTPGAYEEGLNALIEE